MWTRWKHRDSVGWRSGRPEQAGAAQPFRRNFTKKFRHPTATLRLSSARPLGKRCAMDDKERSPSPEFSPLAFGEDLAPLPEYKAAGTTEVDFSGLLGEPLKLREDLKSGCGGQLWPAGMVLAKHMLRYHRERLQSARMSVLFLHF